MNKKELEMFLAVQNKIERLKEYPEIIQFLNVFLKEVCSQVGEFEGSILATNIGDSLYETMEEHGWIEEGDEESKKDIQDMINKSISKEK